MIPDNITITECAALNISWERKHMNFFMKAFKSKYTPEQEAEWAEATKKKDAYWQYGLAKWGKEYSIAHYEEREKQG